MKKTILTLIAFITLLTSVTLIPANAAIADPGETVMPLWDNTSTVNISLLFGDNGYGYAEGTVAGKIGVTNIIFEVVVYKQVGTAWVQVSEKQVVVPRQNGGISCAFPLESGAYYKAEYTFTVTRNGVDEIIQKTKTGTNN